MTKPENYCFICNNSISESASSAGRNATPHNRKIERSTGKTGADPLSNNLKVIFLLRKLLEVPPEQLANLLVQNGHPSEWNFTVCCESCDSVVLKAWETYRDILTACRSLIKMREEIVDEVKYCGRLKVDGKRLPCTPRKRQEQRTLKELRDFVCEHEYDGGSLLADFVLYGDQLEDHYFSVGDCSPSSPVEESDQCSDSETSSVEFIETIVPAGKPKNLDDTTVENDGRDESDNFKKEGSAGDIDSDLPENISSYLDSPGFLEDEADYFNNVTEDLMEDETTQEDPEQTTGDPQFPEIQSTSTDEEEQQSFEFVPTFSLTESIISQIKPPVHACALHIKGKKGGSRKDGPRVCTHCGITFSSPANLYLHYQRYDKQGVDCRTRANQSQQLLICSTCGGNFFREASLMNHLDLEGKPCQHVPIARERPQFVGTSDMRLRRKPV